MALNMEKTLRRAKISDKKITNEERTGESIELKITNIHIIKKEKIVENSIKMYKGNFEKGRKSLAQRI